MRAAENNPFLKWNIENRLVSAIREIDVGLSSRIIKELRTDNTYDYLKCEIYWHRSEQAESMIDNREE
jgi:hypothetical protein